MQLRAWHVVLLLSVFTAGTLGAAHLASSRSEARIEARMVGAAEAFLATLDAEQRSRATRAFEDAERFNWNFVPMARTGLPLKDMTAEQRGAALDLLQSVTSSQGFLKATGVMRLEEVLGILENRPAMRDPENYFFWVFGAPSTTQPWGWRFEGHHVSMSFTSAGGLTVSTPTFMGSNPGRVPSGPHAGWRLLGAEEDLGRELMLSLTPAQRAVALISETAPNDILTGNSREASLARMEGLPVGEMTPAQRGIFMRLLAEYVGNVDPEIGMARYRRIEESGIERMHFAWMGTLEVGGPHYYRIHGPTILIEYDNVQNNANHVHAVWRDLENDFGVDLLRQHYETAGADHGHEHGPATHNHGPDTHTHTPTPAPAPLDAGVGAP